MRVMEYSDRHPIPCSEDVFEIKRSKRDTPPAHFILKIKSFTQLSEIVKKTRDGKYQSDEFQSGDYKWQLALYPNGNLKANGKDGKIKRYNVLRSEHGFDQLLPLAMFNDPSNGYVVDDCCVFGVEVHVIQNTAKVTEFSLIKDPPDGTFTWKIEKFSTLKNKRHYSEVFSAGGYKWKLSLYPKGQFEKDHALSLYINLIANKATPHQANVYVEYEFLIKDQVNGIHSEYKDSDWFGNSTNWGWGYKSFMLLKKLHDASKGFLVKDTLIIEAKITGISVSQDLIS
ncbi:ubiquitin C-terminal hydrolase 12-like [Euphorbia lathyris]|uniref:ubiquitin C-terminal hydrolase 12-like n=1 Tax=Euphorbia lathyris TaxID=212925 RepID=UPI0033130F86